MRPNSASLIVSAVLALLASTAHASNYKIFVPIPSLATGTSSGETDGGKTPPEDAFRLNLQSWPLPNARLGQPYPMEFRQFLQLERLDKDADFEYDEDNVTWQLGSGSLPEGLSLVGAELVGTATKLSGPKSFEIVARHNKIEARQVYTLTVTDGLLRASKMSAGVSHTCAVADGAAYCWGHGQYGKLGNGINNGAVLVRPEPVLGLTSGVTDISVGPKHTCAVVNGAAKCWGSAENGRLGNNVISNGTYLLPENVVGLSSGVTAISAGENYTCALVNGGVQCWGGNQFGQLGNGTTQDAGTPRAVIGLTTGVSKLSTGQGHACAIVSGTAQCWGRGDMGQLGDSKTGASYFSATPASVLGLGPNVTSLSAGTTHTCAVVSGAAMCWGDGTRGQLGHYQTTSSVVPVGVYGLTSGVTSVVSGDGVTCSVQSDEAACWGTSTEGQLGYGWFGSPVNSRPLSVANLYWGVSSVTLGAFPGATHTCGIQNGIAMCWGGASMGQLGDGARENRSGPVNVSMP